jgi:hypothetical protein
MLYNCVQVVFKKRANFSYKDFIAYFAAFYVLSPTMLSLLLATVASLCRMATYLKSSVHHVTSRL